MCNRHNGYENYETWNVTLWLNNERGTYFYFTDRAKDLLKEEPPDYLTAKEYALIKLAEEIKEYVEDENPLAENASMFSDLLQAAISSTNWSEVANSFLED